MELSDRVFTLADFRSVDADAAPSTRSSKRQGTQARREDVQRLDQPADLEQWGVPEWVQVVIVERSEEHTSELQSLMPILYAVFGLQKNIFIMIYVYS